MTKYRKSHGEWFSECLADVDTVQTQEDLDAVYQKADKHLRLPRQWELLHQNIESHLEMHGLALKTSFDQ